MADRRKTDDRIKIGISTCLLGQKVRFDGGHKHDRYITDMLGQYFRFLPVCPELEIGMGVPREAVRLEGSADSPQMVGNKTRKDWTEKMVRYSEKRVRARDLSDICGYILKKDSPSCGMERVKIYGDSGMARRDGVGLYAASLLKHFPLLPIEEEGRLNDARLRENFIVRVFSYRRLQNLFDGRFTLARLVRFHTVHKYLLLAHSPKHYKQLGQLVAAARKYALPDLRKEYAGLFMEAFSVKTTAKKNVNVMHHIMGFLKNLLTADRKKDILRSIEDYRNGLVPLVVPLTLIRHYVVIHDIEYVCDQVYLNPYPDELMLRNHV
ncbi:MAG: DUF523 and DUF1722 domain-containing protein [Candidatus Zixiibacteriota bacterium]|nr:MAG: DUF523 and DUF1722 domain-containing protein [candidate division Zixibacteria bacterium]